MTLLNLTRLDLPESAPLPGFFFFVFGFGFRKCRVHGAVYCEGFDAFEASCKDTPLHCRFRVRRCPTSAMAVVVVVGVTTVIPPPPASSAGLHTLLALSVVCLRPNPHSAAHPRQSWLPSLPQKPQHRKQGTPLVASLLPSGRCVCVGCKTISLSGLKGGPASFPDQCWTRHLEGARS